MAPRKHWFVRCIYQSILPELDEANPYGGQGRDGQEDEQEHGDLHVHPPLPLLHYRARWVLNVDYYFMLQSQ